MFARRHDLRDFVVDEALILPSHSRTLELVGALDPLEDPRPRARRRSRQQIDPRTARGGPTLAKSPRPALAARSAWPCRDGAAGLLQVAGTALGPRQPRRPRLSRGRRRSLSAPRSRRRVLARARLLPRVHRAHRGGGIPRPRGPAHARSLSPLRVTAGQRAVLGRDARDRRRPRALAGGAAPPLAMARRRLELRPPPGGGYLVVHGDAPADARAWRLRTAVPATSRCEGRARRGGCLSAPTSLQARIRRTRDRARLRGAPLPPLLALRLPGGPDRDREDRDDPRRALHGGARPARRAPAPRRGLAGREALLHGQSQDDGVQRRL